MSEKQSWDMELNELKFWGFVGWIALFVLVVVAIVGLNKRLSSLEEVYKALLLGIQDYVRKCGFI